MSNQPTPATRRRYVVRHVIPRPPGGYRKGMCRICHVRWPQSRGLCRGCSRLVAAAQREVPPEPVREAVPVPVPAAPVAPSLPVIEGPPAVPCRERAVRVGRRAIVYEVVWDGT